MKILLGKNHIDGISKAIARNVGALNMLKCCIPQTEETSVADMLIIFLIKTSKSCRVKSIDIEVKSRQILLDGLYLFHDQTRIYDKLEERLCKSWENGIACTVKNMSVCGIFWQKNFKNIFPPVNNILFPNNHRIFLQFNRNFQ